MNRYTISLLVMSLTMADVYGAAFYVNPQGDDQNSGLTASVPLKTIQKALDYAQPGDEVLLAPGHYDQDVKSVRSGSENAPIRISGNPLAVVRGQKSSRIFQINHSYIILSGFTIDGLFGDPNVKNQYRDKLLYIQGIEPVSGPKGIVIDRMHFRNGGGECVRLRYFVQGAEIRHSTFDQCGVHDFQFAAGGKNGEAIYIGTSSNQWADGKNPTPDPDQSSGNWIHHNTFFTAGNECVDIKEGSEHNIIEYNSCSGQLDPDSAGFDSRGDYNVFRYNRSFGNTGAGFRLGGHSVGGHQYGIGNHVYGNSIYNNGVSAIKIQTYPQGIVCENEELENNKSVSGSYGALYAVATNCAGATLGQAQPITLVTASSDDGNVAANTLDGRLDTRWSAKGDGQWIQFQLQAPVTLRQLAIAWYKGNQRRASFEVQTSLDGNQWNSVFISQSSGTGDQLQYYQPTSTVAEYVRIVGFGNSENQWNSITEVVIMGD